MNTESGRGCSSGYAPCSTRRRCIVPAPVRTPGGTTFCRVSKCARLTRPNGLFFYSGCGESSRIADFSCHYANTAYAGMSIGHYRNARPPASCRDRGKSGVDAGAWCLSFVDTRFILGFVRIVSTRGQAPGPRPSASSTPCPYRPAGAVSAARYLSKNRATAG